MAEPIPIKERIERLIVAIVGDVDGVGSVHRGDERALASARPHDAVVFVGEETPENAPFHVAEYTLPVAVLVIVTPDETLTVSEATRRNRWEAKLKAALAANRKLTESGGAQLAIDSTVASGKAPAFENGLSAACVTINVHYRTQAGDPYASDGATRVEEE